VCVSSTRWPSKSPPTHPSSARSLPAPRSPHQPLAGGQRVATVLIYLNDVSEGGGTYFPKLDVRFTPKAGRALVFFPCSLDGALDPLALHTAEKAVDEKWVCQVWVRQGEFK
jgi:prolyl 4-hydroxylase